jgi:hypothetical protein
MLPVWSMAASGEAADESAERLLIDRLRLVFSSPLAGTQAAQMTTDYHGVVDLTDLRGLAVDETERRRDPWA